MKKLLTPILVFFSTLVFSQDYVRKTDGTTIKGEVKSFENNILKIQSTDNQLFRFNVNELIKIFISREDFKMNNINLQNSRFETSDEGILITLGEEAISGNHASKNHPKSGSYSSSGKGSYSSSNRSSSSESISSKENDSAKGTVYFGCRICANKGKLQVESTDGTSSASWAFDGDESAFPHKMKLDANKKYEWSYYDKKNGWIEGTLKVGNGEILKFDIEK